MNFESIEGVLVVVVVVVVLVVVASVVVAVPKFLDHSSCDFRSW